MTTYPITRRCRAALLALAAVIVAASGCSGGDPSGHASTAGAAAPTFVFPSLDGGTIDVTAPHAVEPAGAPAASPQDAVARFTAAEIAGDATTSYDDISAADRDATRGRTGWIHAHSSIPRLRSAAIIGVTILSAAEADVRTDVTFEPHLDEVNGLVPANATVAWRAVAEDGGWRVAYAKSTITPQYPDDTGASRAVQQWVVARQRCAPAARTLEYSDGLVGVPALADHLCGTSGVAVDAPQHLGDRPDPSPVLAAFGPEADRWARLVHVSRPVALEVVTAPLGDHWIVIGVLADRA